MIIRPITCQDRDKIFKLLKQRGSFNEKEVKIAMEVVDAALSQQRDKEYEAFCACDDSGDLVGYVCFGLIPITDDCYDLYWIVVDERFSRMGVAGKLLQFTEDFTAERGARRLYVDTSSTLPYKAARSFYKKHRYDIVCVLTDFYREGDHKMIFMKQFCRIPRKAEMESAEQKPSCVL